MNTALRRTRNGITQTQVLEGEASPEVLEELRAGYAPQEAAAVRELAGLADVWSPFLA